MQLNAIVVGISVENVLKCAFPLDSSVDRDRLRERQRQARAQMSSQVAEQDNPAGPGAPLFGEPVRVSLTAPFYLTLRMIGRFPWGKEEKVFQSV